LIKDYDLGINYRPGKRNVIADALSRRKYCKATFAKRMQPELRREIKYLNLAIVNDVTVTMEVKQTLEIRQLIKDNKTSNFSEDSQGTLWLGK
jgi:hypothetical protein